MPNFDLLTYNSPHFSERNGTQISAIVAHCVGVPLHDLFTTFDQYQVSAHYVVPQITAAELVALMPDNFSNVTLKFPDKVPAIQLVDDSKKAWHAGLSSFGDWNHQPGCHSGLNAASIGIEFHAPGYANGDGSDWYKFVPYSMAQQETGIELISYLMEKHNIPKENLLAHSTISVGRKTDPGPLFFWKELADHNIGYLPEPQKYNISLMQPAESIKFIQDKLIKIGFNMCPQSGEFDQLTQSNIDAYVMQFAPELWSGTEIPISVELLDSLNGFDATISSLSFAGNIDISQEF